MSAAAATLVATATAFGATLVVGDIEILGVPFGFDWAYGFASNSAGSVAGYAWREDRFDGRSWGYQAMRSDKGGVPVALSVPKSSEHPSLPGFVESFGQDIAENGSIVGNFLRWIEPCEGCGLYGIRQVAIWDNAGNVKELPPGHVRADGWSYAEARAISPNGKYVVGHTYFDDFSYLAARWTVGDKPRALKHPEATFFAPLDVNDQGAVAGYHWDGERYVAGRWEQDGVTWTKLRDLVPGGSDKPVYEFSVAFSLLSDGSAIGYQHVDPDGPGAASGRAYAVRWNPKGEATDISPPGSYYAVAYDANDAGQVLMYVCMLSTGCQFLIARDGALEPVQGGWIADVHALSEERDGIAWLAGYGDSGGRPHAARWSIKTGKSNAAPVVKFVSATASTEEGSAVTLEPMATDEDPDALTYEWDITNDDFDDFVAGAATLSFTPPDNGFFPIRVRVTDGGGLVSDVATVTVAARNLAPTATFTAGTTTLPEGSSFTLALSSPSDPSSIDAAAGFASAFDCGAGFGPFSTLSLAAPFTTTCTTSDNGERLAFGAIRDKDGSATTYGPATVTVTNVAPSVTQLVLPAAPVAINTVVAATAHYGDPGTDDTHQAQFTWDWDLGANAASAGAATSNVGGASATASSSTTYGAAGVYTVRVAVTDDDGGVGSRVSNLDVPAYVVVYDPSAGFVTGGGWIASPAGACRLASCTMETTGKATFGFVSRYRKGANTPDGNTEFEFAAGGLRFRSASYEWLVVAGARAQFKGEGSINGASGFRFLLTSVDGQVNGGSGTDRFRIKVWRINADGTDGEVVYDNQMNQADDSNAASALGGGSIVIHSK